MKVHITSTPDLNNQLLYDIINILSVERGELVFQYMEPYSFNQLSTVVASLSNFPQVAPLTFEEFFRICNLYRAMGNISEDDYVVVITEIENDREWFSAFNGKDIFINATEWEALTNKDRQYAIAYEIIENIFQSLLNIDISIPNYLTEPNIHHVPIGCINDMCDDERQIIFKLRTGYICDSCFERAVECGVSDKILLHIYRLIQKIRENYMNYDALLKDILTPYYIDIYPNEVQIGEKKVRLGELPESVFRFFLNHPDGVKSLYDDTHYAVELLEIYSSLKRGNDQDKFRSTIRNLCDYRYDFTTFSKVKNDLAKKLREQIGEDLLRHYIINESIGPDGQKYLKIDIPPMYVIRHD